MTKEIQDLILRAATEDLRMTEAELRVERKERTTRFLARSFGVSEAMASEIYDRVRLQPAAPTFQTHCTVTGERL